ncbi:M3 family metallopeptidase [Acinetobacter rathckeae]|uniref:M3 family metallopeptidase n=1 Tax=Acinetobacter rathckeae TaxID=2605272 RepID=UPI0018A32884|nr:M3 family metallopeptidase [Acinetobacter rathckeae]MBF7688510.1 M3 family metallopeptidase [Acinetobacter rathckeae]MBF7695594.1 M3 family metallopeptidase [Acinetobacter rathckeae]
MALTSATLPVSDFSNITIAQLKQNVEDIILKGQSFLDELKTVPNTIEAQMDTINNLDELSNQIDGTWGVLSHLNSVMSNAETREAYQAVLPQLSQFLTQIGQHTVLYQTYQTLHDSEAFKQLSEAQQSAIRLSLDNFKRSGVALEGEKKKRFADISARLSQLSSNFSNHVLDATQAYVKPLTDAELKGLPDSAVELLKQYGQQHQLEQAVATLEFPSYIAILTYAEDRALREALYKAYCTKASDQGSDPALDNTAIIEEILQLRQEKSELLGFKNFAEFSIAEKMAPDAKTVHEFLLDLAEHAKKPASEEIEALKNIAAKDGITQIQPWDATYYSEKLKQQLFNLSQEELKPYFPAPKVLQGLFSIIKQLYKVEIIERKAPVWHKDVQYFEIEDQGQVIAGFYFDLYARQGKRGGAWMNGARSRMQTSNGLQKPICYMVCNFTPPVADQPALITHDEVTTLFHEFGHGLHHMLTEVDNICVAGVNGVAWDAVELPSQFMEFWTWDKSSLDQLTGHISTKETLPQNLLDALLNARFFQSGMQTLRQIEFALFDLSIHMQDKALNAQEVQQILNELRAKISVLPTVSYNRFQHSFNHIFAGGYAAGYYSYKWAEVLASDAFERFEQEGLFNQTTGQAFRSAILAVGGKNDALDAFIQFRGREPKIDALLRHQGWTETTASA